MITECNGIVLRQIKALKGRRMILLFTDIYGSISAGTTISERGKSGSAISIRPFTLGRYMLKRDRGYTNILSGESVKSYYSIGENYEKYVNASVVLEFLSKIVVEGAPAPELYEDTVHYMDMLETRGSAYRTLTVSWLAHALIYAGVMPAPDDFGKDQLISPLGFDKLEVLAYLTENPLTKMSALALDENIAGEIIRALLRFAELHLDTGNINSGQLFST